MICPRCGERHLIEQFPGTQAVVLSGFLCDGWFYRVEAFQVSHVPHEHPTPPQGDQEIQARRLALTECAEWAERFPLEYTLELAVPALKRFAAEIRARAQETP